jgi:hypothetical protein
MWWQQLTEDETSCVCRRQSLLSLKSKVVLVYGLKACVVVEVCPTDSWPWLKTVKCSPLLPKHFTRTARATGFHWILFWVDLRVGVDILNKRRTSWPYWNCNSYLVWPAHCLTIVTELSQFHNLYIFWQNFHGPCLISLLSHYKNCSIPLP